MGRVAEILTRARDILNDPTGSRWSDANLLRILNEGQQDVVRHTEILRDTVQIPLQAGVHTYALPFDLVRILRVVYENRVLPVVTHDRLDKPPVTGSRVDTRQNYYGSGNSLPEFSSTWMTETTEDDIRAVIVDKLNRHRMRVFPRPIGVLSEAFDTDLVGVTVAAEDDEDSFVFNSLYGVAVNVIDSSTEGDAFNTTEGVITNVADTKSLIVYYSRKPVSVVSVVDDPEIDCHWDTALARYISGNALLEDVKELNRSMGQQQLNFYNRELGKAEEIAKADSTSADHYETTYNGMG